MRPSPFFRSLLLFGFVLTMAIPAFSTSAHATFISPPRVVIDSNKVAGEMTIMNKNLETQIYTFKWQDRGMDENGKIITGDDILKMKDYKPASDVLVYSPRQVILEPGEMQRIRFFVKRDKMTDGEYRSHILIKGQPAKEKPQEKVEGLGGSIGVVAQAGIPVMVRHGKTTVDIEPELFEIVKDEFGQDKLRAKFVNNSTRTIYAKCMLYCKRPGIEEPERIQMSGIRMYHEATYFDELLSIRTRRDDPAPSLDNCESLRLELTDRFDFEYKRTPFYSQVLK